MSNIEVHQCSRFCLVLFLFALSHLLFIIIDKNCPLSKVLCRIIIQVGHQNLYFLGPLYVTLFNWLCHLWYRLWRFSHIEKLQISDTSACYRFQIEVTFESQSKMISLLWWIPSRITLSTAVQTINLIKRLFHLWFSEVMWSIFTTLFSMGLG